MSKRILVVGNFNPDPTIYTYARSFFSTFEQLGFATAYVDCLPRSAGHQLPYLNKILQPVANVLANKRVIQAAAKHCPDVVFIIKGHNLLPSTIQAVKKTGPMVVNFYPDNPFALWNNNGTAAVLKSLPLFDCFLSWSPILTPCLLASGVKHVCPFPFAYDETIYNSTPPLQITTAPIDVCFIGTWEPAREVFLAEVINRLPGVSFGIWGNLWQEHAQAPGVKKWLRGKAIYAHEMTSIYKNALIVLNFLRDQNSHAHNMRTFEVPATKSFLLTERTEQQAAIFFQENYSIACFSGIDELTEKIKTYLHDTDARIIMSERSFVAAQDYTLSKQLLNYMEHCPALRARK